MKRCPFWRSPVCVPADEPVAKVIPHLYLLSVFAQGDPALIVQAQFLLDGGMSERCQCGAPGSQSSAGLSVELRTESWLHSNADEEGQKRGEQSGFLQQPGGSGLCLVVRHNLTGISSPKPHRKGHQLAWKQLRGGYFPDKTRTHIRIPSPGRVE